MLNSSNYPTPALKLQKNGALKIKRTTSLNHIEQALGLTLGSVSMKNAQNSYDFHLIFDGKRIAAPHLRRVGIIA
jgi:hypothetical protein